jgi:hypothetical protein
MRRNLVTAVGVLAVLVGLLWVGQGIGLIRWPSVSFMIDRSIWALWGGVLAITGGATIWWTRQGR